MANKMLIDAAHPEETRVVVLRGNRVEEFDFESASRRQLRGNIYLAKVTRVEPSLQAAFVDYGGNRHGFLAFSEIHPDYYQIPVADRQALIEAEEREIAEETAVESARERRASRGASEEPAAEDGEDAGGDDEHAADSDEPATTMAAEAVEAPSIGEPLPDEPRADEPEQPGEQGTLPEAEGGDAPLAEASGDELPAAAEVEADGVEVVSDDRIEFGRR